MGMGSGGYASISRGGIPVRSAVVQSAVNTLRNWRIRREANGKPPSADDVAARIQDLWPDIAEADVAEIIKGTLT
jgi:hypothetical protein